MMRRAAYVLGVILIAGCRSGHRPEAKASTVVWRTVGSWSGQGNAQTESFDIGFEQCRIVWETRNETAPGTGTLRVAVHSAVSGRELAVAVDAHGIGHDIAYVAVDPHYSYLVIESSNVEWSVKVEEPGTGGGEKQ